MQSSDPGRELGVRKITITLQLHCSNCFEFIGIGITLQLHYSSCFELINVIFEELRVSINSSQTGCIVKGEAQESPLFCPFSGGGEGWIFSGALVSACNLSSLAAITKRDMLFSSDSVNRHHFERVLRKLQGSGKSPKIVKKEGFGVQKTSSLQGVTLVSCSMPFLMVGAPVQKNCWRLPPCAAKTCAVRPVFAPVVGELRAPHPSKCRRAHEAK